MDIGTNEYTGEVRHAARTGIRVNGEFIAPSPRFNANQCKSMLSHMDRVVVEKAQATHPDIARVALRDMMQNKRFKESLNPSQITWINQLLAGDKT